jgi:hypothetical protein
LSFPGYQARLQLFTLAYNLGSFLRRLALPKPERHWSLTMLREKLVKTGAKVTRHCNYVTFRLPEVSVTRNLFAAILHRIARCVRLRAAWSQLWGQTFNHFADLISIVKRVYVGAFGKQFAIQADDKRPP